MGDLITERLRVAERRGGGGAGQGSAQDTHHRCEQAEAAARAELSREFDSAAREERDLRPVQVVTHYAQPGPRGGYEGNLPRAPGISYYIGRSAKGWNRRPQLHAAAECLVRLLLLLLLLLLVVVVVLVSECTA
jgi:hypothetical protein